MSATRGLTDKPITPEVVEEDGRTVAVHTTTVVTDPTAANAVQVPDADQYPSANATHHDDLSALAGTSPADALDNDETSVNEVQRVTPSGTISGGTFTLTLPASLGGNTTSALAYDSTAATVQTALDTALGQYARDGENNRNVVVTGGPANTAFLAFTFSGGDVAGENQAQITSEDAALTGTSPVLTDSTATAGVHADD